jgi:hypothetical protein
VCSVGAFGFIRAIDSTSPWIIACQIVGSTDDGSGIHLENEKPLMVQIDATSFEQRLHPRKITRFAIDRIPAHVVLEGLARDDGLRVGNDIERIWARLQRNYQNELTRQESLNEPSQQFHGNEL